MEEQRISVELSQHKNYTFEQNLVNRYAIDIASAASASFLVSPFITIVDRAIIQNASGVKSLSESASKGLKELFLRPHIFFRRPEFWMVFAVYSTTYSVANAVVTTCERKKINSEFPKFLGASAGNIFAGIAKDRALTRMFGATTPRPLPVSTYGLFAFRDGITIAASFNMPQVLSLYFQDYGMTKRTSDTVAQLICPAAIQFVSTPFQLLGLDLYNNPRSTLSNRIISVREKYLPSVYARICRIGPAFGIGGVGNKSFRNSLQSKYLK